MGSVQGSEMVANQGHDLSPVSESIAAATGPLAPAVPTIDTGQPPNEKQVSTTMEDDTITTALPSFTQLAANVDKNESENIQAAAQPVAQNQQGHHGNNQFNQSFQQPFIPGQYAYQPVSYAYPPPQWFPATSGHTATAPLAYAPQSCLSQSAYHTPPQHQSMSNSPAPNSKNGTDHNGLPLFSPTPRRLSSLLHHHTPPPSEKQSVPSDTSTPVMPQLPSISPATRTVTPKEETVESKNLVGQVRAMGLKVENMEDPPMCHICWHMCCLPGSVKKHITETHKIPYKDIPAIRRKSELIAAGFAVPADVKAQRGKNKPKKKKNVVNNQQEHSKVEDGQVDKPQHESQQISVGGDSPSPTTAGNNQQQSQGLPTPSSAASAAAERTPQSKATHTPKAKMSKAVAHPPQPQSDAEQDQRLTIQQYKQQFQARAIAEQTMQVQQTQQGGMRGVLVPAEKSVLKAAGEFGWHIPHALEAQYLQAFNPRPGFSSANSFAESMPGSIHQNVHQTPGVPPSNGSNDMHRQSAGTAQDSSKKAQAGPPFTNQHQQMPWIRDSTPADLRPKGRDGQERLNWTAENIDQAMARLIQRGEPYPASDLERIAQAALECMNNEQRKQFRTGDWPTDEQLQVVALQAMNAYIDRRMQTSASKRSFSEYAQDCDLPRTEAQLGNGIAGPHARLGSLPIDGGSYPNATPHSNEPDSLVSEQQSFVSGDGSDTPHKRQKTSYGEILVPDADSTASAHVGGTKDGVGIDENVGEEDTEDQVSKTEREKLHDKFIAAKGKNKEKVGETDKPGEEAEMENSG